MATKDEEAVVSEDAPAIDQAKDTRSKLDVLIEAVGALSVGNASRAQELLGTQL